jgi:REP element-mobilizing transposase RayT
VHKHLRRLQEVWVDAEIYLINVCSHRRQPVLASEPLAPELVAALRRAAETTGWRVGRYVIMPDHVHFFCWRGDDARSLSEFVGSWKSWTTHRAWELGHEGRLWQREFFDHLLRDEESYAEKWEYVRQNPVRAGLCSAPEQWPYQGDMTPGA